MAWASQPSSTEQVISSVLPLQTLGLRLSSLFPQTLSRVRVPQALTWELVGRGISLSGNESLWELMGSGELGNQEV